ncbi:Putative ribonuclease H protein At1g65750 [Linum grandiflorum]
MSLARHHHPSGVALNSDGSIIPETGRATAGGLFCDVDGRCLAAYSMNLGICTITRAELKADVTGLKIAWEKGYRRVRVQLDSQVTIQLLLAEGELSHQHSSEVASFREMLDRDWLIKVEYIYREGNRTADFLAGLVIVYHLIFLILILVILLCLYICCMTYLGFLNQV